MSEKTIRFGFGSKNKLSVTTIATLWTSLVDLASVNLVVYEAAGAMTAANKATVIADVKTAMTALVAELVSGSTAKTILNALINILVDVVVEWIIKKLVAKGVITYTA